MVIGFAQGAALALLLLAHDRGIWPGSEPTLSTALLLAGLIAPLALLEPFGQVAFTPLLLWSGTLGFAIATLGLWQQWRGGLEVLPVTTIALLVFLAHVTVRAILREGRLRPGYLIWTGTAWTIGARLLVWGAIAALSFVVIASLNGLFGWVLAQLSASLRDTATFVSMPLMGMASAAGFAVAAKGGVQKRARSTLLASFALALPILGVAALVLPALYLAQVKSLQGILPVVTAILVIAVHAFDWRQVPRRWHMASLGFFGFAILASTLIAGLDLHARVTAHGWTDIRIYAAAATVVLALYGLVYLAESVSTMRGGPALEVLDRAYPLLAFTVAIACLMLSTPLLDPLALAVKSQVARLDRNRAPQTVDFGWLRSQGGRFGYEALAQLESHTLSAPLIAAAVAAPASAPHRPPQPAPETASGPRVELSIAPEIPRPAAAPKPAPPVAAPPRVLPPKVEPEPAGDIVMHTAGEFPAELLAQNWSRTDAAPCITQASIPCDAWFLDLDGDGRDEILFAYGDGPRVKANVMRRGRGRWMEAAAAASPPCPGLLSQVRSQHGGLLPGWRKALRAGLRLGPGAPPAELPCPRS